MEVKAEAMTLKEGVEKGRRDLLSAAVADLIALAQIRKSPFSAASDDKILEKHHLEHLHEPNTITSTCRRYG